MGCNKLVLDGTGEVPLLEPDQRDSDGEVGRLCHDLEASLGHLHQLGQIPSR